MRNPELSRAPEDEITKADKGEVTKVEKTGVREKSSIKAEKESFPEAQREVMLNQLSSLKEALKTIDEKLDKMYDNLPEDPSEDPEMVASIQAEADSLNKQYNEFSQQLDQVSGELKEQSQRMANELIARGRQESEMFDELMDKAGEMEKDEYNKRLDEIKKFAEARERMDKQFGEVLDELLKEAA